MSTLSTNSRCAVLGSPISHSRSPQLHLAAYGVLGLSWSYDRIEKTEPELAGFLADCDQSWRGLSLTMPLKREAARLASTLDAAAERTNAVNTLVPEWESGSVRWHGYNTDVPGLTRALTHAGAESSQHALILGTGATATSAVLSLRNLGVQRLTVAGRSAERAQAALDLAGQQAVAAEFVELSMLSGIDPVDLAVSTLPGDAEAAGMDCPVAPSGILLDASYSSWPSKRAEAWTRAGGRAFSGLSMLAEQALLQVRLYVLGSIDAELPKERDVMQAMYAAVGLNAQGL